MNRKLKGDKGIPWVALLGSPMTKRKIYLEHAARDLGLHVLFIDWKAWNEPFWEGWFSEHGKKGILKIDPPSWDSTALDELPALMEDYQNRLSWLEDLEKTSEICFFNPPGDIRNLLNKRLCKAKLMKAGLPVTEEVFVSETVRNQAGFPPLMTGAHKLLEEMKAQRIFQVFIKPNYGSGALGVSAFCFQHRTGRMVLYTCAAMEPNTCRLVNTRRLQRLEDPEEIFALLNQLLKLDCIIERWYAKTEYQGFTYDLRAVVQDGQMDFLLARLSRGPITNLQLNNHPLSPEELNLPSSVLASVASLCQEALRLYPGMRSAGIDILLEKTSLKPRIIEMNGQGDLIYQDIYQENKIYRHQIQMLQEMQILQEKQQQILK